MVHGVGWSLTRTMGYPSRFSICTPNGANCCLIKPLGGSPAWKSRFHRMWSSTVQRTGWAPQNCSQCWRHSPLDLSSVRKWHHPNHLAVFVISPAWPSLLRSNCRTLMHSTCCWFAAAAVRRFLQSCSILQRSVWSHTRFDQVTSWVPDLLWALAPPASHTLQGPDRTK